MLGVSMRRRGTARIVRRLKRLVADRRATSDVEYILLTSMVVFLLFVIPPLLIRGNKAFFDRVGLWINLPFP
jgi:hypothetical protein